MWTCATCGKIPGPGDGCDDEYPDDCDDCWSMKITAVGVVLYALIGWLP